VTVLFLDIEGYSRLSEALSRPTMNAVVERYFSLFLAPIRAEGGDINETAGDGLMIIFQDGESGAHAAAAVRAALAIREQTARANADPGHRHPPILVNIGISSGECDVGTTRFAGPVGERWTFTASGPVTNLAARLGSHATGGQILLSPETAIRVRDRFPVRSQGLVSLKNLSVAVEVWRSQAHRTRQPISSRNATIDDGPERARPSLANTPDVEAEAGALVDLAQEVLHEERAVLLAVAQGRHLEHRPPEPIVEVLAECAAFHPPPDPRGSPRSRARRR
jgi:class 3 adenylate cyclase